MRKVLSFVLVLAMILGSVSMAFAASPTDVVGKDSEEAVNVLMEFGVVTGYPDGSFRPAGIVTRAEMAAFVIRALGLNPTAPSMTQFKDVPVTHWSSKYVAYATNLGIIKGRTATVFDPEATVSYDEAVTMLVRALGYTEASLNGTYPAAYISKAKALGILGSMPTGTAGANRGDIAKLVFNTLTCAIGKVGTDNIWIAADPEDTMMERLGASDYAPTTTTSAGAEFVVTGDEDSIIPLREYQGALVTAYANSDNEIIAIKEVNSVFYEGEVSAAASTTAGSIAKSDEIGDYTVKAGAYTAGLFEEFANGANVSVAPALVDGNTYTFGVKISGNYITKIYSVSSWASDHDAMVDDVDIDDIADNKLFGYDIITDDNDAVDYTEFALYGVATLGDIKEDDVVFVYASGGDIKRIDVGQEVVNGVVSKITSSNLKATVAGKVYELSAPNAVAANDFSGLATGDEVTFYLDYTGGVYDYEIEDASADLLGLVIAWDVNTAPTLSQGDSMVKLFLADGTTKTFAVDDDDLTNASTAALFPNGVNGGTSASSSVTVGSVMSYGLDSNGRLNALEQADATHSDNSGTVDFTVNGSYGGRYIASDATIFTTDGTGMIIATDNTETAGNDDGEWGVTTLNVMKGKDNVKAFYSYDTASNRIDWMVIEGGTATDDIFAVHNGYAKVNTDAGYEVYTMVDGNAVTYEAESVAKSTPSAFTGLGFFKLTFDTKDYVTSYTEVTTSGDPDWNVISGAGITPGAVMQIKNNVISMAAVTYSINANIVVYAWDTGDGEWTKGSTTDIKDTSYAAFDLYDIDGDSVYDYALVK